jgi:4-hydroxybutyrate CoA-transferase
MMNQPIARATSADSTVQRLQNGMNVFVHGAAATPTPLLDALVARSDLRSLNLFHMHLEGCVPFALPDQSERFHSTSLFAGPALREPIAEGRADFIPVFLSDIPALFQNGRIRLDAALVQLSPPDQHGLCTLGTSVDCALAAVESAPLIIAEVNFRMPRTHGHSSVPVQKIAAFVATDRELPEHTSANETPVEARIGELVADLIEDRSCLQLGIGSIPDAVARRLQNKQDLGIHTEMFSDGVMDLCQ